MSITNELFELLSVSDKMILRLIFLILVEHMTLHLEEVDKFSHGQVEVLLIGVSSVDG
jgi:hypothetical protein